MPITIADTTVQSSGNVNFQISGTSTIAELSNTQGLRIAPASPSVPYRGVRAQAFNTGSLAGFKNKIINGNMDISQRGSTFTNPGNDTYTLDRWRILYTTSATFNVTWQSDAPANSGLTNSLRLTVTGADTSIASTDSLTIRQRIEGVNALDFFANEMRVTFWFKATVTGLYSVAIFNGSHDRSNVKGFNVTQSNTWLRYSMIFSSINSAPAGGTFNKQNGIGLQLAFTLMSGTSAQTTPGFWQTGTFIATNAGQVNALNAVNNIVAITGVQLQAMQSPGISDENTNYEPLEHRDYGTELALCQRYYQEIGTSGDNILVYQNTNVYPSASAVTYYFTTSYATSMRPTPTASLITSGGTWGSSNGLTLSVTPSINTIRYNMTVGANPSSSVFYFQNWNPSNRIVLDSEL
jgi:hypothetical protein